MRIILFGGSFDPPHIGHVQIAQHIIERGIADQLIFIPCKDHPFDKQMSPAIDRIAMLKMFELSQTSISLYEIDQPGKSYSFDTLSYFSQTDPANTYSWLIGADQVAVFDRWHEYQKLLASFKVYVYPRAGYSLEKLESGMELLAGLPPVEVSSTEVRDRVATGRTIDALVPSAIELYIQEHRLYQRG